MTDEKIEVADPRAWYEALTAFVEQECARPPLLDGHMLGPLEDWQRRITGGSLIEFLEWVTSEEAFARYKVLQRDPITERIFLCVTDRAGAVAFNEIVDRRSDQALFLYKDEWRAYLDDPANDHDDAFACHYEFWSAWHRQLDPRWELPEGSYHQLWVHEEGFVVGEEAGRGSQHVWDWDGERMNLIVQDINRWVD